MMLLAGAIFWQILLVHEEDNLVEVTRVAAQEIETELGLSARTLGGALSLVGAFQEGDGELDRWQARIRLLLARFPQLLAVELYDDAESRSLLTVSRAGAAPVPPLALATPRTEDWIKRRIPGPATKLQLDSSRRQGNGRSLAGVIGIRAFAKAAPDARERAAFRPSLRRESGPLRERAARARNSP
jgi:hypothetical protein